MTRKSSLELHLRIPNRCLLFNQVRIRHESWPLELAQEVEESQDLRTDWTTSWPRRGGIVVINSYGFPDLCMCLSSVVFPVCNLCIPAALLSVVIRCNITDDYKVEWLGRGLPEVDVRKEIRCLLIMQCKQSIPGFFLSWLWAKLIMHAILLLCSHTC